MLIVAERETKSARIGGRPIAGRSIDFLSWRVEDRGPELNGRRGDACSTDNCSLLGPIGIGRPIGETGIVGHGAAVKCSQARSAISASSASHESSKAVASHSSHFRGRDGSTPRRSTGELAAPAAGGVDRFGFDILRACGLTFRSPAT
jgi:hypothetical protein